MASSVPRQAGPSPVAGRLVAAGFLDVIGAIVPWTLLRPPADAPVEAR